ncbi:MAG: response regulator [Anaerolineae bacterium]|nr:response regulator [Anaerolineae bacterium]MDW8298985.1 response regulator [Anaerolineae bacterium]
MPKLLVVDDEPLTVEMLQMFLEINGYETVAVLDGESALLTVQVESPDAVLLDLQLPDLSGIEVCRRLRTSPELSAFAELPIIIITAHGNPEMRRRAFEAGANAYFTKPIRFPELLAELRRLLAAQQAK